MMDTRTYRLRLHSPLHVGERGIGLETALPYLPSDTLFSALVVTWDRVPAHHDAVATLAEAFRDQPPLLLTSAFPFAGDTLLLPKPAAGLLPSPEAGQSVVKPFKRVRWVSHQVFQSLVSGINQTQLDALWRERCLAQGGEVWLMADEARAIADQLGGRTEDLRFWGFAREPKVTVDRVANASAIFHVGRVHFAQECGLWCMAQGAADWLARVEEALTLLADSGIGGKRSQGSGQFALDMLAETPDLGDPAGDHVVLLSRLSPKPTELPLLTRPGASYQLVT